MSQVAEPAASASPEETVAEPAPRKLEHTWQEARALSYELPEVLPAEQVTLSRAHGRKLAADVLALHPMPHFASSAMDGWAVAGSPPWILAEAGQKLTAGQASPIVTGAVIPPGAKAVLRSESGTIEKDDDGLPVLLLGGGARPGEPRNGQHIRPAAEESAEAEVLIRAGARINPAHVALAALGGNDSVSVCGVPAVDIFLTGDEVLTQEIPPIGMVRDAFSDQLGQVVTQLGGKAQTLKRVPDALQATLDALADSENAPADVVITTGGTGKSSADFLRAALVQMGAVFHIDGIAMRPGHPTMLAELPDGRFVIALPGNPLAAMTALLVVGAPLIAKLANQPLPKTVEVASGQAISASKSATRLVPYKLLYGFASPRSKSDSAMMRGLAEADGLMVIPPHGVKMGESLTALELPWL